jgi:hypothetical protein
MSMRLVALWYLGLTLTLAGEAFAQEARASDSRARAVARLRPGHQVRIHARGLGRVEGAFLRPTEAAVVLSAEQGERFVPVVAIDSLWVRGTAAGRGAILGSFVGAVVGAIAMYAANQSAFEVADRDAALIGAGFGLASGAFVGTIIGAVSKPWKRWYP